LTSSRKDIVVYGLVACALVHAIRAGLFTGDKDVHCYDSLPRARAAATTTTTTTTTTTRWRVV